MRWVWRSYLHRYAGLLFVAVLFMALEGAMFGALSYIMKPLFDTVFLAGNEDALLWVGLLVLGIFCVRAVSSVTQKVLLTRISQSTIADIRIDMLEHLMTLDASYHQINPPGHLMQRVENDVDTINRVWRLIVTGAGRDFVALISLMAVALSVDWKWTVVAMACIPLLIAPTALLQRYVRRQARRVREVAAHLYTRLNEVFHGIIPIKLNAMEAYQSERYRTLTRARVKNEVRTTLGEATFPGMFDVMAGLGFMAVLFYGGGEIIAGEKTVGDFMAFFTAIGLTFEPLRRLGAVAGAWEVAAAGLERIRALLHETTDLTDPEDPLPAPSSVPDVVLDNVHLAYGDLPVLQGASFVAEAGKTTALVGASGAGKSTVFNILTRLVDPLRGAASIGGIPVSAMRLADLRALFSVVSQEALLFDETLRENILLGQENVTDAQLERALDAAHVTDFLPRLPQGLDSPAGPRGTNLSGGQRQRVAIARALLRDTPILLLDEATSALDAQSEAIVQKALDTLSEGRTTLVIAHRLATIRNADKIVVMDKGKVIDQGSHAQLLARGGVYADLYRLQFAEGSEPE
ncbi:MAG: ABC transporter ATP-binding protein/permease [Rhodobacteraceae bacterium]|nr:ABC transporter ATP-binding protein/permease [Paracoccaceae bacterium]